MPMYVNIVHLPKFIVVYLFVCHCCHKSVDGLSQNIFILLLKNLKSFTHDNKTRSHQGSTRKQRHGCITSNQYLFLCFISSHKCRQCNYISTYLRCRTVLLHIDNDNIILKLFAFKKNMTMQGKFNGLLENNCYRPKNDSNKLFGPLQH